MNKIHKFVACLVRPHWMVYILLGMTLTSVLLYLIRPSDEELHSVIISYVCYPTLIAWAFDLVFKPIKTFYSEFYDVFHDRYGTGFSDYRSDPNFYQTIISDIGFTRKKAGYFYAISKMVMFLGIGSMLASGVYPQLMV